jgi:hypothetical protein
MIGAQQAKPARMTEDQIGKIVDGLGGLLALLREADPRDRAEVYARIGPAPSGMTNHGLAPGAFVTGIDDHGRMVGGVDGRAARFAAG